MLLKNTRDKRQFWHLARQVYPEDSVILYKAYLDAIEKPHGYLLLDLAQDKDKRLRFRTRIFPNEKPSVIYTPTSNEMNQLSHSTTS
jgi:hypothetical protein